MESNLTSTSIRPISHKTNIKRIILKTYTKKSQILSIAYIFSEPVFGKTSRGATMICAGGYKFLRQCELGGKTRWWCGSHYNRGCRAVIYTTFSGVLLKSKNVHNHPPPPSLWMEIDVHTFARFAFCLIIRVKWTRYICLAVSSYNMC